MEVNSKYCVISNTCVWLRFSLPCCAVSSASVVAGPVSTERGGSARGVAGVPLLSCKLLPCKPLSFAAPEAVLAAAT